LAGPAFVNLTTYGGIPNESSYDNTPALNAALSERPCGIYLPQGKWYFHTKPNDLTYPVQVVGDGFGCTYLIRSYAPQTDFEGLLTIRSLNCRISRLGIGAARSTAGASAIAVISDDATISGFTVLEDIYISTDFPTPGGTWSYAVNIDGSARSSSPVGARDIDLRNCSLFASTNAACRISGGVAISLLGGGLYPAAGTTGRLHVTGSSAVPSQYVSVDTTYMGGLSLDNCRYVNIRAAIIAGDITNANSASNTVVIGTCTGAQQNYWTKSQLIDPSAA